MGILSRKLYRELSQSKGQWIAVGLVVMIGILSYNLMYSAYENLKLSRDEFYRLQNFSDAWFNIGGGPVSLPHALEKKVPGVEKAEGRIVFDSSVKTGDSTERLFGRIHSYEEDEELNRLYYLEGGPIHDKYGEIILEKQFAEAHDLHPGDDLEIISGGIQKEYSIAGIVSSPEYIYAIRSAADLWPSPEKFAIIFSSYSLAKSLWPEDGGINQVYMEFAPGFDREGVIDNIEEELEKYQFLATVERDDHVSHKMLDAEITQLRTTSVVMPGIFLMASAVIIYIILKRIVENQRRQIGLMKALGYSDRQLGIHYLTFGLISAFAGSLLGGALGQFSGLGMTRMYTMYFNIPMLIFKPVWSSFFIGIGLSVAFAVAGGLRAVKGTSSLRPAEAMRPAAPREYHRKISTRRFDRVWGNFSLAWRYSLRNVIRNGGRSFITVAGVALSVSLIVTTFFSLDSIDYLMNDYFERTQTYDLKIVTENEASADALVRELENHEGIDKAEAYLEIPVKAEKGWKEESFLVVGVPRDSRLFHLFGEDEKEQTIPRTGILIAERWADDLGVGKGDVIRITPYLGSGRTVEVPVRGVVLQYLDYNCFADRDYLNGLLGEGGTANSALLEASYRSSPEVRSELLKLPGVAFIEKSHYFKDKMNEFLGLTYVSLGIMVLFAGAIAFSILYVTNAINLLERRQETALLRTSGYSTLYLSGLLVRENLVTNITGILIGFPLGRAMAHAMIDAYAEEIMTFPVVIYPRTYLVAAVTVLGYMYMLRGPNRKYIRRMNLVEVMKEREG